MKDNESLERLLRIALLNCMPKQEHITYRKVIFVMGAPGSGKTSLCEIMKKTWDDETTRVIEEVGGNLREKSNSESDVFELPFEFTTLALEAANISTFSDVAYYDDDIVLVDGGILQNYAHMSMRTKNVDEQIRDILGRHYTEFMNICFRPFYNAYFIILRHREKDFYNDSFEGLITGAMIFIDRGKETLDMNSMIISSEQIGRYIEKELVLPGITDFLKRFGTFNKLC